MEQVFTYEGDLVGAQGWALQHGWTISDGSGPEDAVLARADRRPRRCGRARTTAGERAARPVGQLDLVAFDVVYALGPLRRPAVRGDRRPAARRRPRAPALPGPALEAPDRRAGARPRAANEAFDPRWPLLAAEDGPQVRRLVQDPAVQGLLLGTDDGDEFWTGGRARRRGPPRRPPAGAARAPRPAADRARRRPRRRLTDRAAPLSRRPRTPARPAPTPAAGLRELLPLLRPHRRALVAGRRRCRWSPPAAALAQPLLVARVIDAVGAGESVPAAVARAGRRAGRGARCWARSRQYLLQRTAEGVVLTTRRTLADRLLRLPVAEYDRRRTGDLMSRVGADTTLLRATVTSGVVEVAGSVVIGVGALIAMALVDVWLLLLTVLAGRDRARPSSSSSPAGSGGCPGRRRRRSAR